MSIISVTYSHLHSSQLPDSQREHYRKSWSFNLLWTTYYSLLLIHFLYSCKNPLNIEEAVDCTVEVNKYLSLSPWYCSVHTSRPSTWARTCLFNLWFWHSVCPMPAIVSTSSCPLSNSFQLVPLTVNLNLKIRFNSIHWNVHIRPFQTAHTQNEVASGAVAVLLSRVKLYSAELL